MTIIIVRNCYYKLNKSLICENVGEELLSNVSLNEIFEKKNEWFNEENKIILSKLCLIPKSYFNKLC